MTQQRQVALMAVHAQEYRDTIKELLLTLEAIGIATAPTRRGNDELWRDVTLAHSIAIGVIESMKNKR